MDINHAPTLEEVELAFDSYEQALVGNDVAKLDELFWNCLLYTSPSPRDS